MQLATKYRGGGALFLLILFMDRRAGKTKKHRRRKGVFNGDQHIAKGGAMRLVDNKHHAFLIDQLDVMAL